MSGTERWHPTPQSTKHMSGTHLRVCSRALLRCLSVAAGWKAAALALGRAAGAPRALPTAFADSMALPGEGRPESFCSSTFA